MNSPLDNPDQDLTNQSEPLKVWMALLHNASYLQNICLTKFTWDKKRVCLCVYWVSKEFIRLLCKNKRHFLFSTLTCSLVLQRLLADYQITNDCKYKLLHLCAKEHIFICVHTHLEFMTAWLCEHWVLQPVQALLLTIYFIWKTWWFAFIRKRKEAV